MSRITKILNRLPLQTVLTLPFVLQVVAAVAFIGYLLCIIAFLLTLLIGFLLTRWLSHVLLKFSKTAQEIAHGDWDRIFEIDRSDVLGELSRSFAEMAHELQASFRKLQKRVEDRTNELIELNQELQNLALVDGLTQVANRR